MTLYIFDRDAAGQWGFTAIADDGRMTDSDSYELLSDAVANAEGDAGARGEHFETIFSINSRQVVGR